ncbi:MAG: hypothetical protein JW910_14205 [Anaerolineae bacterium]|nr:hypothetical protein [Anaerolineae bacterium]
MASNSGSWFYQTPTGSAYMLQERVNSNLWMARLWGVYFMTDSATPPFSMHGQWQGQTLSIEWEPGEWLRLYSQQDAPDIVNAFSNILQLPAVLTFTDPEQRIVTEWHRDGGEARWRQIQGNPTFQSPVRLNR